MFKLFGKKEGGERQKKDSVSEHAPSIASSSSSGGKSTKSAPSSVGRDSSSTTDALIAKEINQLRESLKQMNKYVQEICQSPEQVSLSAAVTNFLENYIGTIKKIEERKLSENKSINPVYTEAKSLLNTLERKFPQQIAWLKDLTELDRQLRLYEVNIRHQVESIFYENAEVKAFFSALSTANNNASKHDGYNEHPSIIKALEIIQLMAPKLGNASLTLNSSRAGRPAFNPLNTSGSSSTPGLRPGFPGNPPTDGEPYWPQ